MLSKKVRSENSFRAYNAHTSLYWVEVSTGGIRNSSVNPRLTLNGQFPVENKQPIRVMLGFQMALEGLRRQAHAADITLQPMTFRSGVDWSLLLRVVRRFRVDYSYVPREARHDFCFVRVHPEANAFKEGNEYIHGALQPNRIPHPTSPLSTKTATISLHASENTPLAASLLVVQRSHSLITASTQTYNIKLDSGPL